MKKYVDAAYVNSKRATRRQILYARRIGPAASHRSIWTRRPRYFSVNLVTTVLMDRQAEQEIDEVSQYGGEWNSFKAPCIRSDALVVDDNLLLSGIQGEQFDQRGNVYTPAP